MPLDSALGQSKWRLFHTVWGRQRTYEGFVKLAMHIRQLIWVYSWFDFPFFMFKFLIREPQTTWRPGLGLYTSHSFQNSLALLNKILIWLASAPILLIYDLCMLFLRWLNIATKSKLAWLKRIFLFPNALFRIQYSSAENTIPGGLHFALFRIDISTTRVLYNNIQEYTGVSI